MSEIFSSYDPVAVVFDCFINGLGVIRSLGEKNIPVLGLDYNYMNIGRFSRYCESMIVPNPNKSQEKFINSLINIGKKFKTKAVLFPMNDEWLIAVSKNRDILEKYYLFPMPSWRIIQNCLNKKDLYKITQKNNIPFPQTFFEEDLRSNISIAEKIKYPCIMKISLSSECSSDFRSRFGKSIYKISNKKELLEKYVKIKELKFDFVIQQIIPGGMDNLYTFGSYFNKNLEPLAVFTGKKIRQEPYEFGTCLTSESVNEPQIVKLATKLIRALGYYGISQVEFKKDAHDGKFKLMEINARSWKWNSLASACGVNLPYVAYLDITGREKKEIKNQIYGKKWILSILDLYYSILGYRIKGLNKYKLSFRQWLHSIKGDKVDGIFSIKDPMPGLIYIINLITSSSIKIYRILFKKNC